MTSGRRALFLSYDGMTDPLGPSQVLPYLVGLAARGHRITLISFAYDQGGRIGLQHDRALGRQGRNCLAQPLRGKPIGLDEGRSACAAGQGLESQRTAARE